MASWADLLPGSVMPSRIDGNGGTIGQMPGTIPVPFEGDRSVDFGGRFVNLGRRALRAYQAWQTAPVARFDVSIPGQRDDEELAKMIAQYGAIPAESDLGQLAIDAGARVYKQRVRFADGGHQSIDVVQIGSRRGGADFPEGKARRGRKALTSYRIGTAAWVMRKLHAQQRLGRRLARVASALYPKRHAFKRGKRR